MSTETAKTTKTRVDPYTPYRQIVLDAFRHNVNALLEQGPVASRTELHTRYTNAVGPISTGTFADWLEQAGFKFERTVNLVSSSAQ